MTLSMVEDRPRGAHREALSTDQGDYFLSGSSFFLSLPGMNGLHGLALIGPRVFQTTLN